MSARGSLNWAIAELIMLTISKGPMPTYKSQFGGKILDGEPNCLTRDVSRGLHARNWFYLSRR